MNKKRWLLASLAVFVVVFAIEFVVHHVLLTDLYKQTASIWRPMAEFEKMMCLFWIGYAIFALMFTFIYTKGIENKKDGLGQGLRFGLFIGILMGVPSNLMWYVILPIPAALAIAWTVACLVEMLAAGAAVGLIYRKN